MTGAGDTGRRDAWKGKELDRTLLQWDVHPLGVLSPPWARPAWCQLLSFPFPWVSMGYGSQRPSLREGGAEELPFPLSCWFSKSFRL